MNDPAVWSRLAGAFSLGIARQPLPAVTGLGVEALDAPSRALALTALLAQRLRLAPPSAGAAAGRPARQGLPDDPRPMLPPPAREALRRLDRRLDGDSRRRLAPIALAAVADAGRRPHIFDFPVLEPLLRAAPAGLGPAERAWLGREAEASHDEDGEPIGAAGRLAAFAEARRTDAAEAREDLAQRLSGEPAKLRAGLVAGLAVGLAADDRDLLEACVADRAQGVRDAATALLARLPGSPAYDERLAGARATLGIENKGLLRRQKRLTFKPPGRIAENRAAILQLFEGFTLSALTAELEVSAPELAEVASAAQAALPLLARAAILGGEFGVAAALLAQTSEPVWPGDLLDLPVDWSMVSRDARRRLLAETFQPTVQLSHGYALYRVPEIFGGALDPALASRLLASSALTERIALLAAQAQTDEKVDIDLQLLPLVAMTPPASAAALAAVLAPVPAVRRPKSSAMLAFLEQLALLSSAS